MLFQFIFFLYRQISFIFSIIQFDTNQRVLGHIGLLNGFPPTTEEKSATKTQPTGYVRLCWCVIPKIWKSNFFPAWTAFGWAKLHPPTPVGRKSEGDYCIKM